VIVLDSSVVLALAFMETGWDVVPWGQDDLCMSAVCLVEVVSKLVDRWSNEPAIHEFLEPLALHTVALTGKQGITAGLLRATTRRLGLSLGDRCCFAVAMELQCPLWTADRAWVGLDLGVEVRVIR
jgi:ribonuclease VapC